MGLRIFCLEINNLSILWANEEMTRERNRLIFITIFVSVEPDGSVCFSETISRPGDYFVCRFCFPKTEFRMVPNEWRQTRFRPTTETGAKSSDASTSWSRSNTISVRRRSKLAAIQFIWYVGWIYWWERVRTHVTRKRHKECMYYTSVSYTYS